MVLIFLFITGFLHEEIGTIIRGYASYAYTRTTEPHEFLPFRNYYSERRLKAACQRLGIIGRVLKTITS